MHPILFRIPLPAHLPLGWIILGLGAAVVLVSSWFVAARKARAWGIGLLVGGAAIAAKLAGLTDRLDAMELSRLPIYSYGVMLGLSLVVGWYLTLGLAKRDGLPRDVMANNYVITALSAVLGARVLYIITDPGKFHSFGDFFSFRTGGLVAYGGFLGGFVASWLYLRTKRLRLLPWADVAVPSLASGLFVTRIGCYLYGCDFGAPLSPSAPAWLAKLGTFPHWQPGTVPEGEGAPAWLAHVGDGLIDRGAASSLPVHPTQIYESLVGAGLLVMLLMARKRQTFRGQIFLLFTFGYGVCRFLLEIIRADEERGFLPIHGPAQWVIALSLVLFALGFSRIAPIFRRPLVRRGAQVLAFVPAVVAFFALRPHAFEPAEIISLSTSQFIALATGLAAAAAYAVFHRAALAHPEAAMALALEEASEVEAAETGTAVVVRPTRSGEQKLREKIRAARELPPAEEDEEQEAAAEPPLPAPGGAPSDEAPAAADDDGPHEAEPSAAGDDVVEVAGEVVPAAASSKPKRQASAAARATGAKRRKKARKKGR